MSYDPKRGLHLVKNSGKSGRCVGKSGGVVKAYVMYYAYPPLPEVSPIKSPNGDRF